MASDFPSIWMWSQAFEMIARADRLHREVFRPARSASRSLTWEPPVDVLETDDLVLVLVALPGVNPDAAEISIEGGELTISGIRSLPPELQTAVIHRMELPLGRFERRIDLPPGRYDGVSRSAADGCLMVVLRKSGAFRD